MTTQLSPAERAMAIWHRITEEATASNDHGVIYDGEKIAEIIGSAIERAIAEAVEGEREACAACDQAMGRMGWYYDDDEPEPEKPA